VERKHRSMTVGLVVAICIVAIAVTGNAVTTLAAPPLPNLQRCAEVLEAGTGNWEDSKCTKPTPPKKPNSWVRVYDGGTLISGTEECAEVVEPGTGVFNDSACAEREGTKDWIRVAPEVKFPIAGGVSTIKGALETIECTANTGTASAVGGHEVAKTTLKFTKCKSSKGCAVKSPEAGAEEVRTKELVGELIYLKAEKTTPVGLLLKPASGTEVTRVEGTCLFFKPTIVNGSFMGEVTPINTTQKTGTVKYAESGGKQQFTLVEGVGETHQLTIFESPAVLVSTETLTFETEKRVAG
jgi:hypothetical protein